MLQCVSGYEKMAGIHRLKEFSNHTHFGFVLVSELTRKMNQWLVLGCAKTAAKRQGTIYEVGRGIQGGRDQDEAKGKAIATIPWELGIKSLLCLRAADGT